MALTWRQIEAFRAVMVTGTIIHGAEMLNVSQPAVSRLISDLEHELGYALFNRKKGRLSPDSTAISLYEEVERAFIGRKEIERVALAIGRSLQKSLRIISLSVTTRDLLAHAIAKFTQEFPDVHVSLDIQPKERVIEWVESHRSDIGICTLPVDSERITVQELTSFDLVAVVPSTHRLAKMDSLQPRDLVGEELIALPEDSGARPVVQSMLDENGVELTVRIEAANADALIGLVAAGAGIAVVSSAYQRLGSEVEDVRMIQIEPRTHLPFGLLLPLQSAPSKATQDFISILEQVYTGPSDKS